VPKIAHPRDEARTREPDRNLLTAEHLMMSKIDQDNFGVGGEAGHSDGRKDDGDVSSLDDESPDESSIETPPPARKKTANNTAKVTKQKTSATQNKKEERVVRDESATVKSSAEATKKRNPTPKPPRPSRSTVSSDSVAVSQATPITGKTSGTSSNLAQNQTEPRAAWTAKASKVSKQGSALEKDKESRFVRGKERACKDSRFVRGKEAALKARNAKTQQQTASKGAAPMERTISNSDDDDDGDGDDGGDDDDDINDDDYYDYFDGSAGSDGDSVADSLTESERGTTESRENWLKARRGQLRAGGGQLRAGGEKLRSGGKVAILSGLVT